MYIHICTAPRRVANGARWRRRRQYILDVYMYVCMYMYIYIHMCKYICIYIYTHIYTCIHIFIYILLGNILKPRTSTGGERRAMAATAAIYIYIYR